MRGRERRDNVVSMLGMRRIVCALSLALLPGALGAQVPGLGGPYDDRVRHGVFLEVFGAGGLYSVHYEQHFGSSLITDVGFTSWNFQLAHNGPRSGNKAVMSSVFREIRVGPWRERLTFEAGGGAVAGRHIRDVWAESPPLDTAGLPQDFQLVEERRGGYAALTGIVGLRIKPEYKHDITCRIGWMPMLRLYDIPGEKALRGNLLLSAGFTW